MFMYCKKCGLIANFKEKRPVCAACETVLSPVPEEYLTDSGFMFKSPETRKEFEESIKLGEEYSEEASLQRDSILKEKQQKHAQEIAEKVDEYNRTKVKITCPVCHSAMLDKISNVGKIVKVGAFGILGAGDIGKKYRCKSCGYRF